MTNDPPLNPVQVGQGLEFQTPSDLSSYARWKKMQADLQVTNQFAQAQVQPQHLTVFSPEGYQTFADLSIEYQSKLLETAAMIARHRGSQEITKQDLASSLEIIQKSSASSNSRVTGTIGGILTGTGAGGLLAIAMATAPIPPLGIALAIAATIVGGIMIGIDLAKSK